MRGLWGTHPPPWRGGDSAPLPQPGLPRAPRNRLRPCRPRDRHGSPPRLLRGGPPPFPGRDGTPDDACREKDRPIPSFPGRAPVGEAARVALTCPYPFTDTMTIRPDSSVNGSPDRAPRKFITR